MKKIILSILIFSVASSCNRPKSPDHALPAAATFIKGDSAESTQADKAIGSGLTQEEMMMDDTVFADGTKPTSWQAAGITDVKGFKLFLKQVQLLVLNNDRQQLAGLIRYPLNRSIKNEKDFIKNYDRIFSKDARLSIAKINFSQVFRNSKGVMSEEGKVWFSQIGNEFKITAVNN